MALEVADAVPPAAEIDAGRASQVIQNLLSNAIKFCDDGGTVRVAVDVDGGGCLRVARGPPLCLSLTDRVPGGDLSTGAPASIHRLTYATPVVSATGGVGFWPRAERGGAAEDLQAVVAGGGI